MAIGPKEALELTADDKAAIDKLENFIDNSDELSQFDGADVKIPIPESLMKDCLSTRYSVRIRELQKLYFAVGWKRFFLTGQGMLGRILIMSQYLEADH